MGCAKGIDDDEIIIIENKVSIKNHDSFERNGIDLILKKSITLKEYFCGFCFDLKLITKPEILYHKNSEKLFLKWECDEMMRLVI